MTRRPEGIWSGGSRDNRRRPPAARQKGIPLATIESAIASVLDRLHAEVRRTLTASSVARTQLVGKNKKGDRQRAFDITADAAVRRFLENEFESGIILSEESDDYRFGQAEPDYRFIVDPVDGSDNWARGLPLSSVAVAVLPVDGPIALHRVLAALVGGLEEGTPIIAVRGEGSRYEAERLRTSAVRVISDALISCELNHFAPTPQLGDLLSAARAVRSYGCASRAVTLVARGAIDAHIDVRSRLTPESFLAAAAILHEAGGCVLDARGEPLGAFADLRQRTTLVAAGTTKLAMEIVDALSGSGI